MSSVSRTLAMVLGFAAAQLGVPAAAQPVAEWVEPAAASMQFGAEPAQPDVEPAQPGAESAQPVRLRVDVPVTPKDPAAMTRLAQRYEHAEGLPKNFFKANELYCRAAKAGYAEAQFRLGWIYANGRGVRRDDGVAAVLFVMAAEQGHEYARRLLQYVRAQPNTELPKCLLPEKVEPVHVVVDDTPIQIKGRPEVEALVKRLAPQYKIDPQLVMALIAVESGFNAKAVSPKNAQGLMQLIPETAERFGVQKVFDPAENIKGGLAYLRWLMAFFEGEVKLVLAAYNAGERAVERHRGIPPYQETRAYVQRITKMYRKLNHPYSSEVVAPSSIMDVLRRTGS